MSGSSGIVIYYTDDPTTNLGGSGGSGGSYSGTAVIFQNNAFVEYDSPSIPQPSMNGEVFRNITHLAWGVFLTLVMILETMSGKLGVNMAVFASITPMMLLQNTGIIALVLIAVALLWKIKPLRFSWLSIFNGGQEGGDNINVAPFRIPWLGILFGVLFFVNLPTFALAEERMFRLGVVDWSDAMRWAFIFGMVHCLVGVPLAAGVALTIPGLWFHYQCFEGGVMLSTVHHTAYNAILATLMLVFAVLTTVFGESEAEPT